VYFVFLEAFSSIISLYKAKSLSIISRKIPLKEHRDS
jgi:hypothetical protein